MCVGRGERHKDSKTHTDIRAARDTVIKAAPPLFPRLIKDAQDRETITEQI